MQTSLIARTANHLVTAAGMLFVAGVTVTLLYGVTVVVSPLYLPDSSLFTASTSWPNITLAKPHQIIGTLLLAQLLVAFQAGALYALIRLTTQAYPTGVVVAKRVVEIHARSPFGISPLMTENMQVGIRHRWLGITMWIAVPREVWEQIDLGSRRAYVMRGLEVRPSVTS